MIRALKRYAAVVALAATTLVVVPAQAASASEGCGSDWHMEGNGYLGKEKSWQGATNHNATLYHTGRVRWCTQEDLTFDDINRRALIGYGDGYSFDSEVFKNGKYRKFCVHQTIRAHMTGIPDKSSWSISGTVSKKSPSVSFTYSSSKKSVTVKVAGNHVCGRNIHRMKAQTGGIVVTGHDDSGQVKWVELKTRLRIVYKANGVKHAVNQYLTEKDYS